MPAAKYSVLVFAALVALVGARESCEARIAESIPRGSNIPHTSLLTGEAWVDILRSANKTIEVAAFYWSLRNNETDIGGDIGNSVFDEIASAGHRGVKIRIAQNKPSDTFPCEDSAYLEQSGLAEVVSLDFDKMFGAGVLHTKFIIVDRKSFYVGSANMDWRSLAQVKEMGTVFTNCEEAAEDLAKVFETYWMVGSSKSTVPTSFPSSTHTKFTISNPMNEFINGEKSKTYIASSPLKLTAPDRTHDLDSIISLIENAKSSVSIAVMDYCPCTLYMKDNSYWPKIDDAIRTAVFGRGVHVRLLASWWKWGEEMDEKMVHYLKSLQDMGDACEAGACEGRIDVKLFELNADPSGKSIPYTRVNHNKYMVTDEEAFFGTSNWSGDYFINTGGVAVVTSAKSLVSGAQSAFDRDWSGPYAKDLDDFIHSASPAKREVFAQDSEIDHLFEEWRAKYGKVYKSLEHDLRKKVFALNRRLVEWMNRVDSGAHYALNEFADLTRDEFARFRLGAEIKSDDFERDTPRAEPLSVDNLPASFDWREKGAVTGVKNQGSCGSCWAFSTTGNLEGQHFLKTGKLVALSEQNLVDCDKTDHGCLGGLMTNAFSFIRAEGGIESEAAYPYTGHRGSCGFEKANVAATVSNYTVISSDEDQMAAWLVKNGPISIGIDAIWLQFYHSGISNPLWCMKGWLNHGVLLVGFGEGKSKLMHKPEPYWIVKNSWGARWGEDGYFRIVRGAGKCGLNRAASSAIV